MNDLSLNLNCISKGHDNNKLIFLCIAPNCNN